MNIQSVERRWTAWRECAEAVGLLLILMLALSFSAAHAATFTVTNLDDSGPGSLRQAVLDANANLTATHTIDFQPGLTGTITLTSGAIAIVGRMTINGPGESVLAVSGNNTSRVFNVSSVGTTISGLTIKEGKVTSGNGGGISNTGNLTLNRVTLSDNEASSHGGGISNSGSLTLTDVTLSNNTTNQGAGGGIVNTGALNAVRLTVANNNSVDGAGGIWLAGSNQTTTLTDSVVNSNQESGGRGGGGIYHGDGTTTLTNTVIDGNQTSSSRGGGIYALWGSLTVTNSTLSNNASRGSGGGIYAYHSALTVTNSTLSGNVTNQSGGGIYRERGSNLTVTNSTITANLATQSGGGIFSAWTLRNSIVAGNTALNGKEISGGYNTASSSNLFGENGVSGVAGATPSPSEIISGPLSSVIGPLANNGGPTLTHALVAGSPAINAGDNSLIPAGVTTDQRGDGFPRIVGGTVDIGAVEFGSGGGVTTYALTVGKSGGNGTITSNPAGINCGAVCTGNFNSGTAVTLTASADSGYSFTGWSGDCNDASPTCTVTMDRAMSVMALFNQTPDTYTLTTTTAGTGSGMVGGAGSYAAGAMVALTATPNAGSTFAGWSPSPCAASFAMPANDLTCTATFNVSAPTTYPLTLTTAGTGSGTVGGAGSYAAGAMVALTATPNAGSTFVGWSPSPCASLFSMPANALTCTANFTLNSHTVTATAGTNGSITPTSQTVNHGATTTFTVTPNSGYRASVTGCNGTLSGNTYTTGPIAGACKVSASFTADSMDFDATAASTISWFYAAAFSRTPVPHSTLPNYGDLGGLAFWTAAYLTGEGGLAPYRGNVYIIADFFVQSPEFQARYSASLPNEAFVTALYENMLGRAPDADGLAFWVSVLEAGVSRGQVLADFTNTPENRDSNPLRKAAMQSFIAFLVANHGVVTPAQAAVWLAENPTLDGARVDGRTVISTYTVTATAGANGRITPTHAGQ